MNIGFLFSICAQNRKHIYTICKYMYTVLLEFGNVPQTIVYTIYTYIKIQYIINTVTYSKLSEPASQLLGAAVLGFSFGTSD